MVIHPNHTVQHALPTPHGLQRCLQNQGATKEQPHRDAYPGLCWKAWGNGNGALCYSELGSLGESCMDHYGTLACTISSFDQWVKMGQEVCNKESYTSFLPQKAERQNSKTSSKFLQHLPLHTAKVSLHRPQLPLWSWWQASPANPIHPCAGCFRIGLGGFSRFSKG